MKLQLTKENCVNPIQPYTFNGTMRYYRDKRCLLSGISMLYSFENIKDSYTVVNDACADIMVYYDDHFENMGMDLVGPHDHLENLELKKGYNYFGIRFLPGYSPDFAGVDLLDLKGEIIPMQTQKNLYRLCTDLFQKIKGGSSFLEQCREVMACINNNQSKEKVETTQAVIHRELLTTILESTKNNTLSDLEEYSGYSSRYLNKVFQKRTGYSIMQFSNVLRAQRAGNSIYNCKIKGVEPCFDDIAMELGYSDQSHMIREFKKYFGMTPKLYYTKFCNYEFESL